MELDTPAVVKIPSAKSRVEALDLLRLVAVLSVVLFHFGFNGPTAADQTWVALPQLGPFAKYGYLGVQLFFAISGFVISFSAQGRTVSQFFAARIARLYPAFLFCMTLSSLVIWIFGAPQFDVSLRQWAANLAMVAPALHQPYIDSVYWTLITEMIFYTWIGLFVAMRRFPSDIETIVVAWLSISVINEAWFGYYPIRKIFLTDQSGFFACGMLLFEIKRQPRRGM